MDGWDRAKESGALREHPLFAGLGPAALAALDAASRWVNVSAGEVLVSEGEAADAAYLVLGGRFAVSAGGRLVGELGRGDLLGEMALLVDEPRSATVTARRACVVVRIDGPTFTRTLALYPDLHRSLSAQLVTRLRQANLGPARRSNGRVLAVVTDGTTATVDLPTQLDAAFGRIGQRSTTVAVHAHGLVGAELTSVELEHDIVLLLPDPADGDAVAAACEHADGVLVVVDATQTPRSAAELRLPARVPPVVLVLAHPPGTACPRGTHRWLAHVHPVAHHQVRTSDRAHVERLARHLAGHPIALVLSGGGARGLAHVGTYRAMADRGVPIDVIAGSSAGSIFAVAIARGWDPDRLEQESRRLLIEGGSLVDATLPMVALASGKRINQRIRAAFGDDDLRLEDLWIPTVLVSANLTTADAHEHLSGLAWRAVRASVAIPGVFPPMCEAEGLLVDGGLVDNLPVARLRARYPGAIIVASDAGRRIEFTPDGFPPDGEISGWGAWRLRRRFRRERPIPGVVGLLGRLTALGGAGAPVARGDVHIAHELAGVSMFDFARGTTTMAAGYRRASEVLAAPDGLILSAPGSPPRSSHPGGNLGRSGGASSSVTRYLTEHTEEGPWIPM